MDETRTRVASLWLVAAIVSLPSAGCADPERAVGRRMRDCEVALTIARTLPPGKHPVSELPVESRVPRLLSVYVDARGAYALEFSSEYTVDLNPAFVFVGFDTPDPEAVAREVCSKAALTYRNAFKEPGWHRATGQ
jgi:hypothetical protein